MLLPTGGPLDIACQDLGGAVGFSAPTAWVTVSPVFEAYVDALAASPYRSYPAEHAVDDLATFEGDLYAGVGSSGLNSGSRYCAAMGGACPFEDAPGHGIPAFRFAPGSAVATWDHIVREEKVKFRRLGERLALPGLDPTRGDGRLVCADTGCPPEVWHPSYRFTVGTFRAVQGGRWFESPTVDSALHVYDLTAADGRWYASGSWESEDTDLNGFAAVWGSDDGVRWDVEFTDTDREGTRRVTALLPLGEQVVGLGYHEGAEVQVRIARVNGEWVALEGVAPTLEGEISAEVFDASRALAWAGKESVILEESEGAITSAPLAWLPADSWVVDAWLLCPGSLLVLTREPTDDHAVYLTAEGLEAREVARWQVEGNPLYTLAFWEGDLVFGDGLGQIWRAPPR